MTPTPRRSLRRWRNLLSLSVSAGLLVVPVSLFYLISTQPTTSTPSAQPDANLNVTSIRVASISPDGIGMALDDSIPQNDPGIVHMVEDKSEQIYRLRVTATGDELIIDAKTGKLLHLYDQRTGEKINPRSS